MILTGSVDLGFCRLVDFSRYIKLDESVLPMLLKINTSYKFVIPYLLTATEANDLVEIIGMYKLKIIYLESLAEGRVIDCNHELFKILGEGEVDFCIKCLNIAEDRSGSNEIIDVIKDLANNKDIYRKALEYSIENKYKHWGWSNDILTSEPEIILEILKTEGDNEKIIDTLNVGIDHLEDDNIKIEMFKIVKSRGLLKSEFSGVRIIPNNATWTGSQVPLLESRKESCERIKDIFKDSVEYLDFIVDIIEPSIARLSSSIDKVLKDEFADDRF
jgi:hypothetical protein